MLEFLVGIGLVAYVVWWYLRPRLLGLPPEPTISIPLLGHILAVDWKPETIFKWYKSTGPIFTIRAGHRMTIFVCEIEAIKEVLLNRGDEFAYRPESWLSNALRGIRYGASRTRQINNLSFIFFFKNRWKLWHD